MHTNPKKGGRSTGQSWNQSSRGSPSKTREGHWVTQASGSLTTTYSVLQALDSLTYGPLCVLCVVALPRGSEPQIQLQGQMKQKTSGQAECCRGGAVQCALFPQGSHTASLVTNAVMSRGTACCEPMKSASEGIPLIPVGP